MKVVQGNLVRNLSLPYGGQTPAEVDKWSVLVRTINIFQFLEIKTIRNMGFETIETMQ